MPFPGSTLPQGTLRWKHKVLRVLPSPSRLLRHSDGWCSCHCCQRELPDKDLDLMGTILCPLHPTSPCLSLPPPLLSQCGMKPVCLKSTLRFRLEDYGLWAPGGWASCLPTPFPGGAWSLSCCLKDSGGGPSWIESGSLGFQIMSLARAGHLRIPAVFSPHI